jgi:hypothetical protein
MLPSMNKYARRSRSLTRSARILAVSRGRLASYIIVVKLLALVSCVAACAALTASAAAAKPRFLTPPGNSGITQYSEVVPSGAGSTPTGGGHSSPAGNVPPAAARALAGRGTARKELLQFVGSTAPNGAAKAGARSGAGANPAGRRGVSAASAANPSGSPGLLSFVKSLGGGGSGGMGVILPLILAAALLGAALALWARRRARF